MPTSRASNAIAPCICRASSVSNSSASGSRSAIARPLEEGLEDSLRGDLVAHRLLPARVDARLVQHQTGFVRGQPFVDHLDRQPKTSLELPGEAPPARSHPVL